jgi:hypothetical protein
MKTYVINPDTQKPVSLEEWAKDADPTRAQLLLVDTGEKRILVRKAFLPEGEVDFNRAQELCAAYRPFPESPFTFRAPTRKECIDLYDARFLGGLDEAVRLTGGDYGRKGKWFWTCERDADPAYSESAWYSGGSSGGWSSNAMYDSNLALPVALLTTSEASIKP